MELSETLRVLGDETRLRILNLLSKRELCLCVIKEVLGLMQPNASKHISKLKALGVIECQKSSQWCFFRIRAGFREKYAALYACLENEWASGKRYAEDLERLENLIVTSDCCRELLAKKNKEKHRVA